MKEIVEVPKEFFDKMKEVYSGQSIAEVGTCRTVTWEGKLFTTFDNRENELRIGEIIHQSLWEKEYPDLSKYTYKEHVSLPNDHPWRYSYIGMIVNKVFVIKSCFYVKSVAKQQMDLF